MGIRILGALVFLLGVALAVSMVICGSSADEVKTIDLSAIKTEQFVAGTNVMKPDFECSPMAFAGKSYDLVMVGEEYRDLVYLGKSNGQWYRAEESLHLNFVQEVREVKLDGANLIVVCEKEVGNLILLSIVAAIFVFLGGLAVIFGDN